MIIILNGVGDGVGGGGERDIVGGVVPPSELEHHRLVALIVCVPLHTDLVILALCLVMFNKHISAYATLSQLDQTTVFTS